MPSITFDKFDVGLDRRKGASVSDANRLRECKNAYVTSGKAIRKRPGSVKETTLTAGTKGLAAGLGQLNTFHPYVGGGITHSDSRFVSHPLIHTATPGPYASGNLLNIHYAEVFNQYFYTAAEYDDGSTYHYYIDSTSAQNLITASNCPHSKSCLKAASKMFAIDPANDQIRYSDTSLPKAWNTGDSGFLATGLNARGSAQPTALGQYQERMAVFHVDSVQLWDIDPDSTNFNLFKTIEGVGTEKPTSVRQFINDIVFQAKAGFRSITQAAYTENLSEVDIGSAIDRLLPDYASYDGPLAEYFVADGQLWEVFTPAIAATQACTAFVYTFSKTMKIAAWSQYEFPFRCEAIASLAGEMYIRSGDDVYSLDSSESVFTDDGEAYEMRVEMPFLDFKAPGIIKHITGMDMVVEGEVQVQFRYDPNDLTKITDPITISGDTRPGQLIPIEITATAIAPVFTSTTDEAVQIDAVTFYYEKLGPF